MIFMFSCKCVLAYGIKIVFAIHQLYQKFDYPPPEKLKLCYCPLLKKNPIFPYSNFLNEFFEINEIGVLKGLF